MRPPARQHHHNFKVLPQDITKDSLDTIMDHFKMALGVKCGFCHARSATGGMDMASDDKPEKEIARKMMIMTANINQYMRSLSGDSTQAWEAVTCITCHRGDPHPEVNYDSKQAPPYLPGSNHSK
jgi:hypothetical protein